MSEYRNRPEISRSELLLITNPHKFFKSKEHSGTRKAHFSIGTGVDISLAYGLDKLMDRVVVLEAQPDGRIYDVVQFLIDNDLSDTEENILFAREELNIYAHYKDTTFINKFRDTAQWYYDSLVNTNEDSIMLTDEELNRVVRIYQSVTDSKHMKPFFDRERFLIFNHVDIYFEYKGIGCKAELDQLNIDLNRRTIEPIDYKTLSKPTRFFDKTVKERRYDIQAAQYTLGCEAVVNGVAECPKLKDLDLIGFDVLPFVFLVESTLDEEIGIAPMPRRCSKSMLLAGLYGVMPGNRHFVAGPLTGSKVFQVYPVIPGFDTLINELKYQRTIHTPERKNYYTQQEEEELACTGAIELSPW